VPDHIGIFAMTEEKREAACRLKVLEFTAMCALRAGSRGRARQTFCSVAARPKLPSPQ
jgi:hypothetical protein